MIYLLYVVVILGATTLGAIAGLGGGVIIKPLLDAVGYHDATSIGVYSSVAVFTMCVISLVKQMRSGFAFDRTVALWVSAGSLVGGVLGEQVFRAVTASLDNDLVKAVQAGVLALTLALILLYTLRQDAMPTLHLKSPVAIACVGLALGAISVFLGIGGGPLNVAAFTLFFGLDLKQATVYSLATIFFSQLSKLGLNAASGVLWSVEASFLPAVVLPAIAGGTLGTRMNRNFSDATVRRTYLAIMVALLLLSVVNCIRGLGGA